MFFYGVEGGVFSVVVELEGLNRLKLAMSGSTPSRLIKTTMVVMIMAAMKRSTTPFFWYHLGCGGVLVISVSFFRDFGRG